MKVFNIINYTSNLLASILTLIIGVILFRRPDLVIILISYVLGAFLIAIGIMRIIYYSYHKGKDNQYPLNDLIWALIYIVIGLICIFLSDAIEQAFRFLIGSWILFMGINRLIKVFHMSDKKASNFFAALFIAVLLIVVGVYVILVSNLVISTLGLVLIIYSVLEIINYILVSNENHDVIIEKKDVKIIETKENNKKKLK